MTAKKPVHDLPFDVTPDDCKPPTYDPADEAGKGLGYKETEALGLSYESGWFGRFVFYKTERFGWVLTTLRIGGKGRQATERFYGITTDPKAQLVTIGKGPHVVKTAEVYLKKSNADRLTRYVELWKKGMAMAGDTRDRISTRRANTIRRRNDPFGGLFGF